MNLKDCLLWLSPILFFFTGLLLAHYKKMIWPRYLVYFPILLIAFIFDLTGVSFIFDTLDTVLLLFVTMILSEYYWKMFRFKNRILIIVTVLVGLCLFLISFNNWIFSGPTATKSHWETRIVSKHKKGNKWFLIKESTDISKNEHKRTFRLSKCLKNAPLEKKIKSFKVPDGYEGAEFKFQWSLRYNKLYVDLIGDKDLLWTLDDGS